MCVLYVHANIASHHGASCQVTLRYIALHAPNRIDPAGLQCLKPRLRMAKILWRPLQRKKKKKLNGR